MIIRSFQPEDESQVIDLWRQCKLDAPQNDPRIDIQRKQKVNPEWFLLGEMEGRIVASCMAGYEGHRGWINYLAVLPAYRRCGIGTRMMQAAEERLNAAGCPKINLQVRQANTDVIAFYESIGYCLDQVVSLGKRLVPDEP